jgi:Carbamoyl-phosphate synthase L chain, ATP binding domain
MTPRVLFVSLTNDIGAERIAATLVSHGAVCATLSPRGFYSARTAFIERHFPLPRQYGMWLGTLLVRPELEKAVRIWAPDFIVPLDDVAAWLLRGLATNDKVSQRVKHLLVTSLGSPGGYQACCSRLALMRAAASLGVSIPDFHEARTAAGAFEAADRWGYPVVVKSEFTCGGRGVAIVSHAGELCHQVERAMHRGIGLGRRLRALTRHMIWRRAGLPGIYGVPSLLQAYISGQPAMRTVSTWNGRVLEGASFVADRVHPEPTGSSSLVRYVEHAGMEETVRLLVEKLGCSGFVSFDFLLDQGNNAYLIEMNARSIGTSHLGGLFGHDLCGALVAQLRGKPVSSPALTVHPSRMVALFPKECERDPSDLHRLQSAAILHDVPLHDPPLIVAHLQRLEKIHPVHIEAIRQALGVSPARQRYGWSLPLQRIALTSGFLPIRHPVQSHSKAKR